MGAVSDAPPTEVRFFCSRVPHCCETTIAMSEKAAGDAAPPHGKEKTAPSSMNTDEIDEVVDAALSKATATPHVGATPKKARLGWPTGDKIVGMKSSPTSRSERPESLVSQVALEYERLSATGFATSYKIMTEAEDKSLLAGAVTGVHAAPRKPEEVAKMGKENDLLFEKDVLGVVLRTVAIPSFGKSFSDASKLKDMAHLFHVDPVVCLEAGHEFTSRIHLSDDFTFELRLNHGKKSYSSIQGGFPVAKSKGDGYNNTLAGELYQASAQNALVYHIQGVGLLRKFLTASPKASKVTKAVMNALSQAGIGVQDLWGDGPEPRDDGVALQAINFLFHGNPNAQWDWHKDSTEFGFTSWFAVIVQLSGGTSSLEIALSTGQTGKHSFVGPGAAVALHADLWHKSLAAQVRTVKLVFFFKRFVLKDSSEGEPSSSVRGEEGSSSSSPSKQEAIAADVAEAADAPPGGTAPA